MSHLRTAQRPLSLCMLRRTVGGDMHAATSTTQLKVDTAQSEGSCMGKHSNASAAGSCCCGVRHACGLVFPATGVNVGSTLATSFESPAPRGRPRKSGAAAVTSGHSGQDAAATGVPWGRQSSALPRLMSSTLRVIKEGEELGSPDAANTSADANAIATADGNPGPVSKDALIQRSGSGVGLPALMVNTTLAIPSSCLEGFGTGDALLGVDNVPHTRSTHVGSRSRSTLSHSVAYSVVAATGSSSMATPCSATLRRWGVVIDTSLGARCAECGQDHTASEVVHGLLLLKNRARQSSTRRPASDSHDYTSTCLRCTHRFVARFSVSMRRSDNGPQPAGHAVWCEFLSPANLMKEVGAGKRCPWLGFANCVFRVVGLLYICRLIDSPRWQSSVGMCSHAA